MAQILFRVLGVLGGFVAATLSLLAYLGVALPISSSVSALLVSVAGLITIVSVLLLRPREIEINAPMRSAAHRQEPALGISPAELTQLRTDLEQSRRLERELSEAKQVAEAATMAKGEFLATMSHEIRTPLNGIIPLLDILLSTRLGDDQRDYLNTALQSAHQLLRIVDDILDYSKLEANKLELESVGLNLRDVLDSVMRLMDTPADAKQLKLALQVDPTVRLAVRGDPVRLRQVLTNLVSNAVKFTERGGVRVGVTRKSETRTHHELRFEIEDTGVGITAEAASRLFKPFSQADASTTRTFGGTGLGLVICKRIIDLMGGQIGVDSTPGKGSTFWFQIPMLKAVGDMGEQRRELTGSRILLLTADHGMLRRMNLAAANWGVTLVQASGTQEALSKLRAASGRGGAWAFHILLADLQTARTTAVGLHRSIIKEPALQDLLIAYLKGDDPAPVELAEGGRSVPLARNLPEAELRRALSRLVSGELIGAPPPSSPSMRVEVDAARGATSAPAMASEAATHERVVTPAATQPHSDSANDAAPLQGTVLLVEDNPVNRQVAQRLLSLSGLQVATAEHGREALDKLAQSSFAAVFMDCQMPVMDGYTATREWRRIEQQQGRARLPIIAMTANAMVGDREKCLDAGMDDYLSKPIHRQTLLEILVRWLRDHATPTTLETPATTIGRASPKVVATAKVAPPSPARPNTPALKSEVIEDLRDIMGPEFLSLVRVFLEDAPRAILRLQDAAAETDLPALVAAAHSLKSTSANLGAMDLSELARQIEHGGRRNELSDPVSLTQRLVDEFARVDKALRELLA
jgi:signal transduction histidine kinase/CheY-like chemotaxis protein/HPt (histidine-containing phosphotransfer) domain-containing protein